ncbi:MAG: nucleotidyltransferase family protein [Anaerolineales bacterium]|nr:nucleotidyltransferase family protein [Anaerolineales bacterium]
MSTGMAAPTGPARQLEGDCWPTARQRLLLRAALLDGPASLEAWQAWRAARPAHLDPGSQRLLPVLYRNLRRQGLASAELAGYQRAYRQSWYQNQVRLGELAAVLPAFQAAGMEIVVLKGPALVIQHYRDIGLRPIGDLDLLVRAQQAAQALEIVAGLGWTQAEVPNPAVVVSILQGVGFSAPGRPGLDLHWHVLWEACHPTIDEAFWSAAVPLAINGQPTLALCPTDQLLHVCVHGARWSPIPPLRWAADAIHILGAAAIDWDRLLALAARFRLGLPLRDALGYLARELEAEIPRSILTSLAGLPVSRLDRGFYARKTRRRGLLGDLPLKYQHYRLHREMLGAAGAPASFGRYLHALWGQPPLWRLPGLALRKARERLRSFPRRAPGASAPPSGQDSQEPFRRW